MRKGFSFAEVMIATAISSIVSIVLLEMMIRFQTDSKKVGEHGDAATSVSFVLSSMKDEIRGSLPGGIQEGANTLTGKASDGSEFSFQFSEADKSISWKRSSGKKDTIRIGAGYILGFEIKKDSGFDARQFSAQAAAQSGNFDITQKAFDGSIYRIVLYAVNTHSKEKPSETNRMIYETIVAPRTYIPPDTTYWIENSTPYPEESAN